MRRKSRLLVCLLAFIAVCILSVNEINAANNKSDKETKKCVIVIGDSRVCGLLCTLMNTSYINTEDVSVSDDQRKMSATFRVGNTYLVMSGEMSGRLSLNSYDNSVSTVEKIISSDDELKNMDEYIFINMYCINDLYHNQSNNSVYPARYMAKNAEIYKNFKYCDKFYQFNAGPIDTRGIVYQRGFRNEYIERYNSLFIPDDDIEIVDLYNYLTTNGYNAYLDGETKDHTGLHYDDLTNRSIYRLIMKTSRK